jgi:hypothetical protein
MKCNPLTIISSKLSYNTRNALVKGIVVSIITAIVYLIVVAITTPNLPSNVAIGAAIRVNGIIIVGLAIGVGIQVFVSAYSRGLGCRLDERRKYLRQHHHKDFLRVFRISGQTGNLVSGSGWGGGGGTVMSSFLSFFSLVPLGCCGSWLLILSMLPSVFGGTISVILIEYSSFLSYVGLALVLSLSGLSLLRLNREEKRMSRRQNSTLGDVDAKDDRYKTSNSGVVERVSFERGC